ncbi:MAG: hypothetical protein FWF53_09190 [Candidatus Azobacteroides sp.]|nr:hypothetical protein [Candidatus Azobacteroides sp.]
MAYRFTNTDKWNDSWFYELDLRQKAVFLYLCDLCDIAGFYEINCKRMAQDIGMSDADVKGALKGLYSRIIYSVDGKYLFLRNFIKHQKNFPLNENNPAHKGIIKLLNEKLQLFNFQLIEDYFKSPFNAPSKGLKRGTGNSNSNSIKIEDKDKGGMGEKEKGERSDDELSFEKVWELYERKGNKKTSMKKWETLKNHCREAALKHIPLYVQSTPDKQYRKNFETYLNRECWNDEIITKNLSKSIEDKQSNIKNKLLNNLKDGTGK